MSVRDKMAALVAKWAISTPEEEAEARRQGRTLTKPRATKAEMAERKLVTKWLILEAGRALSRRGVAYRAEALLGLPKTDKAFRYIEEMTLTLRDEGEVPWYMIRDGRRRAIRHGRWPSLAEHLEAAAEGHELDLWAEADVQAQVWIEKEDLADALRDKAGELGLDVWPASGFTGAGFLRSAVEEAAEDEDGRPLLIFLLVDYDSSGNRARETFERRGRDFADELGVEISFVQVALTKEQVHDTERPIPTRPQKESTHNRPEDDDVAAELDAVDALYPGLLGEWLEQAVEPYCPSAHRRAVNEQAKREREFLAGLTAKPDDPDEDETA